jgi:DNA-binding MarR family transcriptional regulator
MSPNNARAARVIYALQRAFVAVEARKSVLRAQVGLLPSHYALMMNVRSHPGVINAELARLLGVSPQNITGLVARLTARGLLERRPHERHAHVLELHLTSAGSQLLTEADRLVGGLEDHVVTALGAPATDNLRTILASLERAVGTPEHD